MNLSLADIWDSPASAIPPHNSSETSRAAACHAAATGQVNRQEREILRVLARHDFGQWVSSADLLGMTRKEIYRAMHCAIPESRVGARVNRLIQNGLCREEGTRVPAGGSVRQKVCFATEAGLAAIREGGK